MSKLTYLLPEKGNFYKANLHSHTTISDGNFTPEEMKAVYKEKGYSIICFSDHHKLVSHSHLNDPDFLTLDGFEFSVDEMGKPSFAVVKTTHINFIDTNPNNRIKEKQERIFNYPKYGDIDGLNKYLTMMNDLGFISFYNHPHWSLETFHDIKDMDGFWGFEIYNHGCEVDGLTGYANKIYMEMLQRSKGKLFCVMTDDNHNSSDIEGPYSDSFGGFTMIMAKSLTYDNIINALINGHFYCSMGPEIHSLYMDNDELHIECDPVQSIFVTSNSRSAHRLIAKEGESLTSAVFKISPNHDFLRVTCKSHDGKFVETNPYLLNEIFKN